MANKLYYTASEVAEMIGVGSTTSYGIIKKLNQELEKEGYLVVDGKLSKEYFDAKYFGGSHPAEVSA